MANSGPDTNKYVGLLPFAFSFFRLAEILTPPCRPLDRNSSLHTPNNLISILNTRYLVGMLFRPSSTRTPEPNQETDLNRGFLIE